MRTANVRFDGKTPKSIALAGGVARVQFALEQLPLGADEVRQALAPYLKYAKGPTLEIVRQQIARSPGARQRELTARFLLLHQDQIGHASAEDIAALEEYFREQRWKSMRGHDRCMYHLLSTAAKKFEHNRARKLDLVIPRRNTGLTSRRRIMKRLEALIEPDKIPRHRGERAADAIMRRFSGMTDEQLNRMVYELESGEPT